MTGFQRTDDVSTTTKNCCLLELYALEMELFWRMGKLANMDVVYCKALSLEGVVLLSQHMSAAHGTILKHVLSIQHKARFTCFLTFFLGRQRLGPTAG